MTQEYPLIIAIDGPSSAGKGTLARALAEHFDFAFLDTGLLYRALGKKCLNRDIDTDDLEKVIPLAQTLSPEDLERDDLRTENVAMVASVVSAIPEVRQALLEFQQNFAASPPEGKKGAVLDGRDIGTVICPDAPAKIFVTADLEVRAQRRYKELQNRGIDVIYEAVLQDLTDRDARDKGRDHAPLKPADDAYVLDTTELNREQVFEKSVEYINSRQALQLDKPVLRK